MNDFIICPKCDRKSFDEGDIKWKFCSTCGYHDTLSAAIPGIPGISPKWRQSTPGRQLKTTLMSLEGHFTNWKEGIIRASTFQMRLKQHIKDIKDISAHMEETGRADSW